MAEDKYRLFVEERDLVFYIDDHEALRLCSDGKMYVWGEFAVESLEVVRKLRRAFIHGTIGTDIPPGPVKIRGDN